MNIGSQSDFAEMREEIVAYLDGELPPEQAAAVERRLAVDDGYRHEMLQMQRTWDMLDQIPRTTASNNFTQSTMEMVVQKAARPEPRSWLKKFSWKWALVCLLAAAAGFGGYALAAKKAAEPNEALARDLPLFQEFELYEEIDSIQFVERLDEEALFSGETLVLAEDSAEENLRTLAEMTPEQLYQLKEQKEKFERRSMTDQQRIRELHQQLDDHPDLERLKRILFQYNQWLARLSGEQRSQLAEMPLEERIAEIKQVKQRQAIAELGFYGETRLPEEDLPKLKKWLDEFVERRQDDINLIFRENGPPRPESRRFPGNQQFMARMALFIMDDQKRSKIFNQDEVASLSTELSPEAQEVLQRALAEGNQAQLLRNWSIILWQPPTEYSEEELQAFFENDLADAQRSEMDQMTPDDRYNVLVGAYRNFKLNNRAVPADWKPRTFIRTRGFGGPGGIGGRPQRPSLD